MLRPSESMPQAHRQVYERLGLAALFFLLACVVSPRLGLAQYRFDQWTADDGLPQNSVFGIVQTRDGYLWLATVDGLARFDGARFTIFNKSNSPGIINNRFVSLFEDARGDLWAGTEESGIVRFSGGRFEHFGVDAGIPRSVGWIVVGRGRRSDILRRQSNDSFSGREIFAV